MASPSKSPNGISTGSFDELAATTMTSASIARARKRADAILQRMTLHELRRDRNVTQAKLAVAMDVDQGEISRIEKRSELKLGTLRDYVSALGGHLEVRAVFPEKNVELTISSE